MNADQTTPKPLFFICVYQRSSAANPVFTPLSKCASAKIKSPRKNEPPPRRQNPSLVRSGSNRGTASFNRRIVLPPHRKSSSNPSPPPRPNLPGLRPTSSPHQSSAPAPMAHPQAGNLRRVQLHPSSRHLFARSTDQSYASTLALLRKRLRPATSYLRVEISARAVAGHDRRTSALRRPLVRCLVKLRRDGGRSRMGDASLAPARLGALRRSTRAPLVDRQLLDEQLLGRRRCGHRRRTPARRICASRKAKTALVCPRHGDRNRDPRQHPPL